MRVLFDQAVPAPLKEFLSDHQVRTASQMGWSQLGNGALLAAAEADGFDAFITTDQNLKYQQSVSGRKIAIIVLLKQQWPDLRPHGALIAEVVRSAETGSFTEVAFP